MERIVGSTRIVAAGGDLTAQEVDAVVNAANEHLSHGGGVAAAIVRAGGFSIQEESDHWVADHGPVAKGSAAVTGAGSLPARWVVHTVGPRYREGQDSAGLLRGAVIAALDAGAAAGARSIAIPAISAGIFGYPLGDATLVIATAVVGWARNHPAALDEIRLIGLDAETVAGFATGLEAG